MNHPSTAQWSLGIAPSPDTFKRQPGGIMKRNIKTLEDALTYQLQGLLFMEKRVKDEFSICSSQITSREVKQEIQKYIDSAESKLLKLERVFNYLLREPAARKNQIVNGMLEETHHLLEYANNDQLKDILMISCVQSINAYKIASYKTAYRFAVELELDTPSELLNEIIQWELQTKAALDSLSMEEFNRSNKVLK